MKSASGRGEATTVESRIGTPALLHGTWPDEMSRSVRVVAVCTPTPPVTVVLGSAQSEKTHGHLIGRSQVAVVHRSSGGGAVLLVPQAQAWIDVWVPRRDPLWDDDVVRSSFWLGRAWKDALETEGLEDLQVHEGRLARTPLSDLVCFAGVGPGEVTWKSRKLVGISQRRNRHGARFQSVSPLVRLDATLMQLVGLRDDERQQLELTLAAQTTCLIEATGASDSDAPGLLGRVEKSLVQTISAAGR